MRAEEAQLFYLFNDWANQQIINACATLDEAQYMAPTHIGSLHTILIHMLDSNWGWRLILEGYEEPTQAISPTDLPTFADFLARWHIEEQAWQALINSLTDEKMDNVVRYVLLSGNVRECMMWHCLLHVANHATQHRSEAAALLTSYGQSPGDLDFTVFLNKYFNLPD